MELYDIIYIAMKISVTFKGHQVEDKFHKWKYMITYIYIYIYIYIELKASVTVREHQMDGKFLNGNA